MEMPHQDMELDSSACLSHTDISTKTTPSVEHQFVDSVVPQAGILQFEAALNGLKTEFHGIVDTVLKVHGVNQSFYKEVCDEERSNQPLSALTEALRTVQKDFGCIIGQLHVAADKVELQQQIDALRLERDTLLSELNQTRNALNVSKDVVTTSVLEATNHDNSRVLLDCSDNVTSACKSHLLQSPLSDTLFMQSCVVQSPAVDGADNKKGYGSKYGNCDSSLTAMANKSLDLSRSLTEKCVQLADSNIGSRRTDDTPSRIGAVAVNRKVQLPQSPADDCRQKLDLSLPVSSETLPENGDYHAATNDNQMIEVRRWHVVREIVETERKYCSCLSILINHFYASLLQSDIVPREDLEVMFPNCLTELYSHHGEFLNQLENRVEAEKMECIIGDVMESFIISIECKLLGHYQRYVGLFPDALVKLRVTTRVNCGFRKILKGLQLHQCCEGLDVTAFLVTPVQRMPRYILLLKQLLRNTSRTHVDYSPIESCLVRLGEFLSQLNESIEVSIGSVAKSDEESQSPKSRRRSQLSTFSFRLSLETSCNEKATGDSVLRKKCSLKRSHPTTSTPVNPRVQEDSTIIRVASSRGSSNRSLKSIRFGSSFSKEKESGFKCPVDPVSRSSFRSSLMSKLVTATPVRHTDGGGSLFDISNIAHDCDSQLVSNNTRGTTPRRSSFGCNRLSFSTVKSSPAPPPLRCTEFSQPQTIGSIPDVAQIPQPTCAPNKALLTTALTVAAGNKTSAFPSLKFFKKKLAQNKSSALQHANNETSLPPLKRKASIRESFRGVFSRKRQSVETSSDITVCSLQPNDVESANNSQLHRHSSTRASWRPRKQ